MHIDKTDGETLLSALQAAIRYSHINNSPYDIRKYQCLHGLIVRKLYRSKEMRDQHWLPSSILRGTDFGTVYAVNEIFSGQAEIVKKLGDILRK